jgi:hypothetical protein
MLNFFPFLLEAGGWTLVAFFKLRDVVSVVCALYTLEEGAISFSVCLSVLRGAKRSRALGGIFFITGGW